MTASCKPVEVDRSVIERAGLLQPIVEQAISAYPNECCGMIVTTGTGLRQIACPNLADQLHHDDPERFPHTSANSYSIDPAALLRHHDSLRCIYHSHPDHGASFSADDQRQAAPWGEPSFPGVTYLVVSILQGRFAEARSFRWNREVGQFTAHQQRQGAQ